MLTLAISFSIIITRATSCLILVSLTFRPRSVRISFAKSVMKFSYVTQAWGKKHIENTWVLNSIPVSMHMFFIYMQYDNTQILASRLFRKHLCTLWEIIQSNSFFPLILCSPAKGYIIIIDNLQNGNKRPDLGPSVSICLSHWGFPTFFIAFFVSNEPGLKNIKGT